MGDRARGTDALEVEDPGAELSAAGEGAGERKFVIGLLGTVKMQGRSAWECRRQLDPLPK
ncbi:hypothetical protein [Parabacteroides sp.]|uniref:hypothetical protein n=1 Tax=Parabacteroides sp. TaxID=1869337 RepID=UPI00257BE302|nr:hypothetical protein [Parabacteroides sp.]